MDGETEQSHYLDQGRIQRVCIRKRDWSRPMVIHHETVEISRLLCCFEFEDGRLFMVGDELDFHFHLEGESLKVSAVISRIEPTKFLDECYEHKTMFCCCAEFRGKIEREIFNLLVGTPLVTRSLL